MPVAGRGESKTSGRFNDQSNTSRGNRQRFPPDAGRHVTVAVETGLYNILRYRSDEIVDVLDQITLVSIFSFFFFNILALRYSQLLRLNTFNTLTIFLNCQKEKE